MNLIIFKIIGSAFVAFSGISIGEFLKQQLNQRLAQLDDMIKIVSTVSDEIDYLDCDYNSIKEKLLMDRTLKHSDFLEKYKTKTYSSFPLQWREAVSEANFITSQKSREEFLIIGDIIGSYQKDLQLKHLKIIETNLKRERDELREYIKTHSKLYKSLSALVSIAIIIIMI